MTTNYTDTGLTAQLAKVRERPDNLSAWDELEALAAEQQAPEAVADLYADVLAKPLPSATARRLGERATQFCEQWFADDAPQMQAVMLRVFELDPSDEGVLDRLTMGLTALGRWSSLLDVYDKAVEATDSVERQIQLLDDAVRVAKDVASDADRAISFLERLVPLKPGDPALRSSLEKLLERGGRWRELIALWDSGLSGLGAEEAARAQVQIASCWLDKLKNAPAALDVMRLLLTSTPLHKEALALTERILGSDDAASGTRRDALQLLRTTFERTQRPLDLARVLRAGFMYAAGDELETLHRDAATLFRSQGLGDEALLELGHLFVLRPDDDELEAEVAALVAELSAHARHVEILSRAADQAGSLRRACELRLRAATIAHHPAGEFERAIALCERVFAEDAEPELALDAGRALDALLEAKNRTEARVIVLERLANLETDKQRKREVLGALAKLAAGRGDNERAVATWRKRLAQDSSDREALDGLVQLYETGKDYPALVEVLRSRAALLGEQPGGRDLARIAEIQAEELFDLEAALATWSELLQRAPSLVPELPIAELLDRSAVREAERGARLLSALADAYRSLLSSSERALHYYGRALAADPTRLTARAGLTALLSEDAVRGRAADLLAGAYASSDEIDGLLDLLPHRLFGATDAAERARLLRQAAQLEEQRRENQARAFEHLAAALAEEPSNVALDLDLWRLAEASDSWEALAEAVAAAAAKLDPSSPRASQLKASEGELRERRLKDNEGAFAAYSAAASGKQLDPALADAVCRTATLLGRHRDAFEVVVQAAHTSDRMPEELLAAIEARVTDPSAYKSLAEAAEAVLEPAKINPPLRRALLSRVAEWRERASDFDGAEALLVKATRLGGPHVETLRRLVGLQRRAPGRALFDSLLSVAEVGTGDLDPLLEAADVAQTTLSDATLAKPVLERLFAQASAALRSGQKPTGKTTAAEAALHAAQKLAEIFVAAGDAKAEVQVLRETALLPIDPSYARELSERAAKAATEKLGDAELAVSLYRHALELAPEDTRVMAELSGQFDKLGRLDELLVVRRRELSLTKNVTRRLELRLDLARVMGEIEARSGRHGALHDNLRESPGHAASIDALEKLLRERSALGEVYELFAGQAAQVEALGDTARAAELWGRAAVLADQELLDQDRALRAYQKVAGLKVSDDVLDALARIRIQRNEPALALPWLQRRLDRLPATDRAGLRVRLAHAFKAAGQHDAAIECLAAGIDEAPLAFELRDLLSESYRTAQRFEDLAALLADSAARSEDRALLLTYAREAASLFCDRLGQPERAIEVLSRAVAADPEDRTLLCLYADGLTAAGRLDEARTVLDTMVQGFGRRRSPERAEVHLRLARVAQAAGDAEEALSQLDTASGMDRAHLGILRALGEMAQKAGQLERAERAYRALLMVVRKPPPGVEPDIGASEVLYQLHSVAKGLGQTDKAAELLESAVQTAAQNDLETRRLKTMLLERGEPALLIRVLEQRLSQVQDPATEAEVLADLADVLEEGMARPEEALEARLKALACAPGLESLHAATSRVAVAVKGGLARYVETLRTLLERARRKEDIALVSDLALRAGSVFEHGLSDFDSAMAQYKLVEPGAPGYIESQFALSRVAGHLGQADEERAVLERIATLPEDPVYAPGKRTARYRLIELQVQDPAAREEGLRAITALVKEDPDFVRAGQILQAACDADPSDLRSLELLELVARQSDEPRVLLDFLERHAQAEEPSLGLIREGAELAVRIKEHVRAEKLLRRALEVAERGDGIVEALWAAILLARSRRDLGDVRGAMEWLEKAMNASDPIDGFELGLELAGLAAGKGKDPARAAGVYEALRERDPADRRVWAPLLEIYRSAGDLERVNDLVRATLEALIDPEERNALRLDTARRMFQAGREDDGAALLHDVLAEDPDHEEATLTLADLYEKRGENEALAELLTRKLEGARERRTPSLIPISLRMGGLLAPTRPEQAVEIYREALYIIPESPELMRAAIDLIDPAENGPERAGLLERYLVTDGRKDSDALELALWLLDYQAATQDEGAFEQALAIAHRVAPSNAEIRQRLENWYRAREDHANLAQMLEQDAATTGDAARTVALLVEVAQIRLHKLGQASEAAALLRKAREYAPDDFDLLKRAVHASASSGELGPAMAEVDSALEDKTRTKRQRVELLVLRAEVAIAAGMHDDAVASLDAAYADAGNVVLEHLVRGIELARVAAQQRNNPKRERELTLRMVGLLHQAGDVARPIELLIGWVQRVQNDVEALRALLELLTAAGRHLDAARVAEGLIAVDTVEALPRIAERLVTSARAIQKPQGARPGLERALARDPQEPKLIALLTDLYNEIGEKRELAALMMRSLSPTDPVDKRFEALRRIGQLLLDAGDVDGALKPLTQASELKPDDTSTVLFIADAHIAAKRFQQAQDLLERAMNATKQRRSPELASLRHRMAKLSQAAGDAQARLEWLNSAIEADMNNGEVASELALVAQNMGQLEIALKALRAITMLKGDCPMSRAEAFYRQAVIVAQKGEPRRAVLWAKKAKQEDAAFPGVDKLLSELGEA